MIHSGEQQNSENALMAEVFKLSDAGAAVIQVRTREPIRSAMVLRKNFVASSDCEHREWDPINGYRVFTTENFTNNIPKGGEEDFLNALMKPLADLRNPVSAINANKEKIHYFVFVGAHHFMGTNPMVIEVMQQYAAILPSTNVCLIFVTPEITLDSIPPGNMLITEMRTPSADELAELLTSIVDKSAADFPNGTSITEDDINEIAQLGLGLTLFEFETHATLGLCGASVAREASLTAETMSAAIAVGKTEVVKQSEILELYPSANMDEVGGMARLKDWIESRKSCYTAEAQEFGIEPPKGAVVVGVPGTGKSLIAKAISSALGIPLVRFDMGRVFSKYVGDSESRVRSALKMVEDMSPCVLFIDEIDKGMSGTANGGDGGVSSRVLGTFLTWLNDCKKPVFTMVTANKVDGLPPELLRKGRFDQIFSVGLPTAEERIEVLNIHLHKRGQGRDFEKMELTRFTMQSEGYVPAEIEAAVKDALILAFNEGEGATLEMEHIVLALKSMIPMSRSNAVQISAILEWAQNNAISVNYESNTPAEQAAVDAGAPAPARRRLSSRKG